MSLPAVALVPAVRAATSLALRTRGVVRSRVVVVGSGSVANVVIGRLRRCPDIEIMGFVDDEPHLTASPAPCRHLGPIADLPEVCALTDADRVLVAFSNSSPIWVMEVLRKLPPTVRISVVPRLFELVTWQSQVEELHGLTVMDVAPPRLGLFNKATKRAMDIAVSCALLVVLLPVMLPIAAAVKLGSAGPVFFRQARVGRNGNVFHILKFRTMRTGADGAKLDLREHSDADGPMFKLRKDPRVTSIGRYLRATSIDELP